MENNMMTIDEIVAKIADLERIAPNACALEVEPRWHHVNAERMERLDRLVQVVSSNLSQAEVLAPELEREALTVQREARALQNISARIDAQLAILREAMLARTEANNHLQALQRALPEVLQGALSVCQIHRIDDVETWLRRDAMVREVCATVGCTLIDPPEGDVFDPRIMQAEQSEFTYDEKLAGRVCRCIMPGLALQRYPSSAPEVLYPAQVCTYSVE